MIEKIFENISKIGNKHKFLNGTIKKILTPHYHLMQRTITKKVSVKPTDTTALAFAQRNDFLYKNSDKINANTNFLADDLSKKTYTSMIKFRQTCMKKDFPFNCYTKNQYFIDKLIFSKDEVFIDCGAFTGDTIDTFLKYNPEYKQIIAFEPDTKIFNILNKKYRNNDKIKLINAGSYDRDDEFFFESQPNNLTGRTIDTINENDIYKIQDTRYKIQDTSKRY